MKHFIYILLLTSLLGLAGCEKYNDALTPEKTAAVAQIILDIKIGESSSHNSLTRVSTSVDFKSSWQIGDEVGLYIVKGNAGLQASGNYEDNLKLIRKSDDSWVIDNEEVLYWPEDDSKLHFYAYYPYSEDITDATAVTFMVHTDQRSDEDYSKSDLLLAQKENVTKSHNAVEMVFSHALALIQVEVKREVNILLNSADLTVTLTNASPGYTFNLSGEGTSTTTGSHVNIKMHQVEGMGFTYRLLVPAQTLSSNAEVSFVQTTVNQQLDIKYTDINSTQLYANSAHKYSLTLDWGIDPNHSYSVGDSYPHVGPSMGIVFMVSNGGKNGKIVSLDERKEPWSLINPYQTTGATDKKNGMVNMRKIYLFPSGFVSHPSFDFADEKNKLYGIKTDNYEDPNATGIWYLPALDELYDLYRECKAFGKQEFNVKLNDKGGIGLTIVGYDAKYWSSSENERDNYSAYRFDFASDSHAVLSKQIKFRYRAFLAF